MRKPILRASLQTTSTVARPGSFLVVVVLTPQIDLRLLDIDVEDWDIKAERESVSIGRIRMVLLLDEAKTLVDDHYYNAFRWVLDNVVEQAWKSDGMDGKTYEPIPFLAIFLGTNSTKSLTFFHLRRTHRIDITHIRSVYLSHLRHSTGTFTSPSPTGFHDFLKTAETLNHKLR